MTIFLGILKILGLILLALLGLALLALLLVLFMPIRLRGLWTGLPDNEGRRHSTLKLDAFWLFHLICFKVSLNGLEPEGEFRIFWRKKNIFSAGEKRETEEKKETEESAGEKNTPETGDKEVPSPDQTGKEKRTRETADTGEAFDAGRDQEADFAEEETGDGPLDRIIVRAKAFFRRGKRKAERFVSALSSGQRKADRVNALINDARSAQAFTHLKNELFFLCRHLRFSACRLKIRYSTGSPDTTGLAFGVIAMLPMAYRYHWQIDPDFESSELYAEGEGRFGVRFCLFYPAVSFLRVLFDRNCRRLKAKMKAILSGE